MFAWFRRRFQTPATPPAPRPQMAPRPVLKRLVSRPTPEDALWLAIAEDNLPGLERAIAAGADVNNRRLDSVVGEIWHTPLHEACVQERPAMLRLLLAAGADPSWGQNPLAGIRTETDSAVEMVCALLAVRPELAPCLIATIARDEFPASRGIDCLKPRVRQAAATFLYAQSLTSVLPRAPNPQSARPRL